MSTLTLRRTLPALLPAIAATSQPLTDAQHLDAFITHRDSRAFEAILHQHGPMVLGVCRRILGNAAEAEDAFQAVFMVLLRKASSIIPRSNVGNWLYGVAYLTATKSRSMRSKRVMKEKQSPPHSPSPCPDDELQELLDEELQRLPELYRSAIVLCDLEGKSIQQAARELGCHYGTLGSRLTRGRRLLAERLQKRKATLAVGVVATYLANAQAAVSSSLLQSTSRAVLLAAPSATVAALTQSVLAAMMLTKLKLVLPLLVILCLAPFALAAGMSSTPLLALQTEAERPLPQPAPKSPVKVQNFVWAVAYTPDGKSLIISEGNGLVRLWDATTYQPVAEFNGPEKIIRSLSVSPDGKRVAAGGDAGITYVWDLATHKVVYQILPPGTLKSKGIPTVIFSPDGKKLAVAHFVTEKHSEARIYEADTGRAISFNIMTNSAIPFGAGRAIDFDPTSSHLAIVHHGSSTGITLINVTTGKSIKTIDYEAPLSPQSVAFSDDGKRLAVGGVAPAMPLPNDNRLYGLPVGNVKVFDVESGKLIDTLVDNTDGDVKALIYTRTTNRLLIATTTKLGEPQQTPQGLIGKLGTSLQCYDAGTHQKLWNTTFPGGMIFGMCLTADEKRLAIANTAGCFVTPASTNTAQVKQFAVTPETPPKP
jgi:RNA polymerase sigma factor (sigma-70 family)